MMESEEVPINREYELDGWVLWELEEWGGTRWIIHAQCGSLEEATTYMRTSAKRYGGQWRVVEVQTIKEVVESIGDEDAIVSLVD